MDIVVTNNPLVLEQFRDAYEVHFVEADLNGVLTRVRDLVHKGHKLLTHPLMGSVKPNESPYKSVIMSSAGKSTDTQSVMIIEECISASQKFTQRNILEKYLNDLQMVDLSLIRASLVNN